MTNSNHLFSTEFPTLLQRHYDALRSGSGISVEVIRERGYHSVLRQKELRDLGFTPSQQHAPGLLIPVWTPDGSNPVNCYRPDNPRQTHDGKPLKYEFPRGASVRLDVPPRCRAALADPSVTLWITEGVKKVDALATHGLIAVALLGVWNFKGKNEFGGVTLLADFDYIACNGRTVNIAFGSDITTKPQVRNALERLTEHLQRKGMCVNAVYLPPGADGQKVGVDDFLLAHPVADLEALVAVPRPAPKAAAPVYQLLDEAPLALARPLNLIAGRAYATTWLWVKKKSTERIGKDGEVERIDPPIVENTREMFIMRDDGVMFGPGAEPVSALGFDIQLGEPPADDKLWRTRGVKAYRKGERPDIAELFRRVADVYDRFIDFHGSLADQLVMCEFSTCASLCTWFTPAFNVLPYIWPTGERGSGKTQWGICWAKTSYLGEVLLSSGSFAAIRDLAHYGAALMFDDAEVLSDPKRCDPNKRELLLAGNRRGARVPLKEPDPAGGWKTRWVNAFCPRAFTAIRTPDAVLASRTIAIPLVRTADGQRGNSDPADSARWPCDQRQLQDDLWATSLSMLPDAERTWAEFDCERTITGREFEPWRAVLVVARLVERHGVPDLEKRMRDVMMAFSREKSEILGVDRTMLVIRALLHHADISDISGVSDVSNGQISVSASGIVESLKALASADDELDIEWASPRSVGRILRRLRLRQERDADRKRCRRWKISKRDLASLAHAYGLMPSPDGAYTDSSEWKQPPPDIHVHNGLDVQNVRNTDDSPEEIEEVTIE